MVLGRNDPDSYKPWSETSYLYHDYHTNSCFKKMAAPMKLSFSKFSHMNLKFPVNLLLNSKLRQMFKVPCNRLHNEKIFSFRTVARKGRLKRFLVPTTLGTAGLSVFKLYNSLSVDNFFSDLIPKVHASSGDNLKTASNNFIADAVDIAASAVVYLRVKR